LGFIQIRFHADSILKWQSMVKCPVRIALGILPEREASFLESCETVSGSKRPEESMIELPKGIILIGGALIMLQSSEYIGSNTKSSSNRISRRNLYGGIVPILRKRIKIAISAYTSSLQILREYCVRDSSQCYCQCRLILLCFVLFPKSVSVSSTIAKRKRENTLGICGISDASDRLKASS
jgi:hypothetical protein